MLLEINMVPEAGLEPARVLPRGILNPLCLPISPLWHRMKTARDYSNLAQAVSLYSEAFGLFGGTGGKTGFPVPCAPVL